MFVRALKSLGWLLWPENENVAQGASAVPRPLWSEILYNLNKSNISNPNQEPVTAWQINWRSFLFYFFSSLKLVIWISKQFTQRSLKHKRSVGSFYIAWKLESSLFQYSVYVGVLSLNRRFEPGSTFDLRNSLTAEIIWPLTRRENHKAHELPQEVNCNWATLGIAEFTGATAAFESSSRCVFGGVVTEISAPRAAAKWLTGRKRSVCSVHCDKRLQEAWKIMWKAAGLPSIRSNSLLEAAQSMLMLM